MIYWYIIMECYSKAKLEELSDILSLISQINRLQIICLLNKNWELSVCDIYEKLNIKQNLASHHLNLLKSVWVLVSRREWQKILYSLNEKFYKDFKDSLKTVFKI